MWHRHIAVPAKDLERHFGSQATVDSAEGRVPQELVGVVGVPVPSDRGEKFLRLRPTVPKLRFDVQDITVKDGHVENRLHEGDLTLNLVGIVVPPSENRDILGAKAGGELNDLGAVVEARPSVAV